MAKKEPLADETRLESRGLSPWVIDGEWRSSEVAIGDEGCYVGTRRPQIGVLFSYLDVVIGSPPSGAINPTVDLQVRLFGTPRAGVLTFRARTLRLGRMLYVGEAEIRHQNEVDPIGLGMATFVNQPVPFPDRIVSNGFDSQTEDGFGSTYGRLQGAVRVGAGSFDLEADIGTPQGTVGGAILGRLAELAAIDLLGGDAVVDELDVRFLNKVKAGPIRAAASFIGGRDGVTTVRIEIIDTGHHDRLVTYALAVCRPGVA